MAAPSTATAATSAAPAAPAAAAATAAPIRIKKWMPIGYWRFPANVNEDCPVCQEHLTLRCLECQANDSSRCGLSFGTCGHVFHVCCITNWVENHRERKRICPLDFRPWELEKQEFPYSSE